MPQAVHDFPIQPAFVVRVVATAAITRALSTGHASGSQNRIQVQAAVHHLVRHTRLAGRQDRLGVFADDASRIIAWKRSIQAWFRFGFAYAWDVRQRFRLDGRALRFEDGIGRSTIEVKAGRLLIELKELVERIGFRVLLKIPCLIPSGLIIWQSLSKSIGE